MAQIQSHMFWLHLVTGTFTCGTVSHYMINVKNLKSLKQCLTATRHTSRNQNSKNQKGAITLAARRHNVNLLLSNTTFLIFAVLIA